MNRLIIAAVLARTGKSQEMIAKGPYVVQHPSGEQRWAIRVEWVDDAAHEYELIGNPRDFDSAGQLAEQLEEAVWAPFPKPGTWSMRQT